MKTTSKISRKARVQTEQSSTQNPLPRISMTERRKNQFLPTESVVNLLRQRTPKFFDLCEVVGQWVWITFTEKQPREVTMTLSELGFTWNSVRQCWQHHGGTIVPRTPVDPRIKYGSYFPADGKPA